MKIPFKKEKWIKTWKIKEPITLGSTASQNIEELIIPLRPMPNNQVVDVDTEAQRLKSLLGVLPKATLKRLAEKILSDISDTNR